MGTFDSKTIRSRANYLILGGYRLCVAVPEGHPLAAKKMLSIQDLHGERLVKVKRGETERLDHFQDVLQLTHPQIIVEEADYEGLRFIPLSPPLESNTVLVWKKTQTFSAAAAALIEFSEKYISGMEQNLI